MPLQLVPGQPPDVSVVKAKYEALKMREAERDARHARVRAARDGDIEAILPGVFPKNWPKQITANMIDLAARDMAEMLAPLPAFNATPARMSSSSAKKSASKRTKIATWYTGRSRLGVQMYAGADWLGTFGLLPFVVEPDFEGRAPRIKLEHPVGVYYERGPDLKLTCYYKKFNLPASQVVEQFPETREILLSESVFMRSRDPNRPIEIVRYVNPTFYALLLPDYNRLIRVAPNLLGEVPVAVAERPKWDSDAAAGAPRGTYDDAIWVQLARARMAMYSMEAADKAIRAPLAVPPDVPKVPFGPDALIRTQNPDKVRRIGLEIPQSALVENQLLAHEERLAARYPEGRSGNLDASVITGRGVEALLGTINTQLRASQDMLRFALEGVIRLCFSMDEKFWPNERKTIDGLASGVPFSETYTPAKDIDGDYTCSVTYGFTAGMDPNRALVFMLQLRGDKLIDRDTVQRNMPFEVDVTQLQQSIDIEEMNDGLKQGLLSMLTSVGMMIQQGQDPTAVLRATAQIIEGRERGNPLHEVILKAFQPPEPPPGQQAPPMEPEATGGMPSEGAGGFASSTGFPAGFSPENANLGPGGRPDLQMLLAGLSPSGKPNVSSTISRRLPA